MEAQTHHPFAAEKNAETRPWFETTFFSLDAVVKTIATQDRPKEASN